MPVVRDGRRSLPHVASAAAITLDEPLDLQVLLFVERAQQLPEQIWVRAWLCRSLTQCVLAAIRYQPGSAVCTFPSGVQNRI